jgi:hypothetical protein
MGRAISIAAVFLLAGAAAAAEHPPGSLEQTRLMVERFGARFATVSPQMADGLEDLYAADLVFRDPVIALTGIDAMREYLRHFGETAPGARFAITDTVIEPGNAVVFWTMTFADGASSIDGVSHMRVGARIDAERDYFDLGEVYDRVPLLNWFTGLVKSRLAPSNQ